MDIIVIELSVVVILGDLNGATKLSGNSSEEVRKSSKALDFKHMG